MLLTISVLILIFIAVIIAFYFVLQKRATIAKKLIITQQDYTILFVSVPKENEKTPQAAEAMFAALHGIYKSKSESTVSDILDFVSFEIVAQKNQIKFYVYTPNHLRDFVEGQIYAQYPDIEIQEIEDYAVVPEEKNAEFMGSELELNKEDIFPIKTFINFEVDPLASITAVFSKVHQDEEIWMQIIVRPVSDEWQNKGISYIEAVKGGKASGQNPLSIIRDGTLNFLRELFLTATQPAREAPTAAEVKLPGPVEAALTGAEEKITKLGFCTKIRLIAVADNQIKAKQRLHSAVGAFKQFNTTNMNGFKAGELRLNDAALLDDFQKRIFIDRGFILNIEELASIYHLPNISVETPSIVWAGAKKGEPPANLPVVIDSDPEISAYGITDFRGNPVNFGIKEEDRRRHMYLIGRTGTGKTNMLQNMAIADMQAGKGVAIVDPHGDFIEHILNFIPDERINEVVLFDPSDTKHPIGFNLLENVNPEMKNIVSSGLIGIFKKLWADSWGPRLEHILRNTILALLEYPGSTMLGIMKMLVDENYRREVVDQVDDPVVKDFWLTEFERYDQKFRTEAVAPIQNKVGQFLSSSTIRNILGQSKSTIDMEDIMDNKKILLINLSKGKIGEDNCALIGAMMITKIQITSMMRSRVPESERTDFYLYVDEFQNFATESFAVILSEARKYRLNIIMANQYIAQMAEEVQNAVFGNVGTMITFRIGATDAPILAKEYIPVFEETDLINLDKYHIYVKMSIDGVTTIPFSAVTIPPLTETTTNRDKVVELSRQKYGRSVEEVEAEIKKRNISAVEKLLQKQGASSQQPTANIKQQAESSKQETINPNTKTFGVRVNSKQEAENSKQQTVNSKQEAGDSLIRLAGWQEVTDVNSQKFYVLYHEDGKKVAVNDVHNPSPGVEKGMARGEETKSNYQQGTPDKSSLQGQTKSEIRNPKSETNPNAQKLNDQKINEIRESIQKMKGEEGHTTLEEGEEHEIKREEEDKTPNPK